MLVAVLLQVAATMAGTVADRRRHRHLAARRATTGDYTSLIVVTVALVVCALVSGWLRSVFVLRSGTIGQAILFDLRRRGYDHIQALSVSFHERFTSGRVISRLTSDVDTLTELLDSGLDGLLTAVFNIAAIIGAAARSSTCRSALIALASLIPLWFLYRWFSGARHGGVPPHPRDRGDADREHRRDVQRHPRGAGVPAREAQRRASSPSSTTTTARPTGQAFKLHAVFIPGTALIGNVATVAVLLVGGYRVADGGLALGVLTAFLLYLRQFYDPMEDVADLLQLAAVGERGAGEDRGRAGRGAVGARAGDADAAARSRCAAR